jgi:hypothetical protein
LSVDLILGNKKNSGGTKSGEHGGWFNSGITFLPKTASLILQCEVSHYHARGTSFLFPETEVLLNQFFEPNETIFLFHHFKSCSAINWNQFTNCFNDVRCLNSCWSPTVFVIFLIFTVAPKFCIPFKNLCTRESIVTISLSYHLESFSCCFAHLETKLNVRSMLHHYELSQRSARYKILNMTDHEQQERSHWPCTGNTMEELACMDKLKHAPPCF